MITKRLREEHKELLPRVEALKAIADSIGSIAIEELRESIERIEDFLVDGLIPHAMAEDDTLYPQVQRLMGAKMATATMSRDHEEVVALARQLTEAREQMNGETVGQPQEREFRRLLYSLYSLVQVHFKKEEEIYLPLLDAQLSPEEGRVLLASMEAVVADAKRGGN